MPLALLVWLSLSSRLLLALGSLSALLWLPLLLGLWLSLRLPLLLWLLVLLTLTVLWLSL